MNEEDFISKLKDSGNLSENKSNDHKISMESKCSTEIELIEIYDNFFKKLRTTPMIKKSFYFNTWNELMKEQKKQVDLSN